MNTTTEILTVNGVVLNTLAKNVDSLAGRLSTPALRTENIEIPGRHGKLRTPVKMFDEGQIVLPMWVVGCDDDGNIPSGSNKRREFYKRVDELTKLFKGDQKILDIRHTLPDGSIRQTFGDAMEAFDWTTTADPKGQFTVVITLPDPFWRDLDETQQTIFNVTSSSIAAGQFAGATAPMDDLVWEIAGPWDSPQLTFADGSWVAYDASIPANQSIVINSGEWELTGGGGLIPDYSKLRHDGRDGRWASLPAFSQDITLAGSNRGNDSRVIVTGRRKYLVG